MFRLLRINAVPNGESFLAGQLHSLLCEHEQEDSVMNETRQYPDLNSEGQPDPWNLKFQALADTLLHHIKEEEEDEKHESKGVYIDFKQLK